MTGTKNYTVNDADIQALLDWAKDTYPPATLPDTRTNQQILLAWVQSWIDGTKDAVQRFKTPAPVVPPPIVIS